MKRTCASLSAGFVTISLCAALPAWGQTVIRVTATGDDVNDGSTWPLAKRTVQAALNAAVEGDQVWVAAGTYVECITLKDGAALYGGFAGNETDLSQRNWKTNETILDGNKSGSVVTIQEAATTTTRIDGFTVRNGAVSDGGGIYCYASSATIANNVITGNTAWVSGGGIHCYFSSPTVTNNTVTGNTAGGESATDNGGGGIYCEWSSAVIAGNTITENEALFSGGGILCNDSSATITGNTLGANIAGLDGGGIACFACSPIIANNAIAGNTANHGGGIYCYLSSPTITNNAVTANTANAGSGIYCGNSAAVIANNGVSGNGGAGINCTESSSAMILNNVVTDNRTTGIYCAAGSPVLANNVIAKNGGNGVYCDEASPMIVNNTVVGHASVDGRGIPYSGVHCASSSPTIVNTIIAFNGYGVDTDGASPTLKSNCVYGNGTRNYQGVTDPTGTNGNVSADPRLVDWKYDRNYHIQGDSPCVDAGDDNAVETGWLDLDGEARIQRTHVDIGADESDGTMWPVRVNAILRVSPDGNDANDGSTWPAAKRTIQGALNATRESDQVWVAAGTYVERITLKADVALYGGFAGNETELAQRDWKTNETILDGNKAGSVVTSPSGAPPTTRIDGFTIRNGATSYGAGIYCYYSSPVIANNTITGNVASSEGGGVYSDHDTGPTITNNLLAGNSPSAICCSYSSSPMIANNVITRSGSHAVYCSSGSPRIINNTIVGNNGGVLCRSSASAVITNTIIAFNLSGVSFEGPGTLTLQSDCVYGNTTYNYSGLTDPTGTNGNVSTDPRIPGWQHGKWHVQPDSPCVDAGDDSAVGSGWLDMDGQARIQGAHVDIGADESDGTIWTEPPVVIVRVSPDGDDANDGSTWPLAKRTVQAGIEAASVGGGEVWVKAGVYGERITLCPGAQVYGGFGGTEVARDQRDFHANATILDGQRAGSVVTADALGYYVSTIDGFTIRNGRASLGGGVSCRNCSPTIRNNTITGNAASSHGGGIYCYSSSPAITNNTIKGNTASSYGGGIYLDRSSPTIESNTITANTASAFGGGIYCRGSSPRIAANTIAGNKASTSGGGVFCIGTSTAMITNNTISGNTASKQNGGGIHCSYSSPTIINNKIAANTAASYGGGIYTEFRDETTIANNVIISNMAGYGGGICTDGGRSLAITNNTILGNTASRAGGIYCKGSLATITNTIVAFNSSGVYVSYVGSSVPRSNCVYGNAAYNYLGLPDPTGANGNISVDPQFANLTYGGWHIRPNSPCADAGDDSVVQGGSLDMDGQARIQGTHVDIGADESDGTEPPAPGPNVIAHVSPDGNDANDGLTWATAKWTVQAGIDAAAPVGGDVWVKSGTYLEQVTLHAFVHMYGGFKGTETARGERNFRANETILDGQQGGAVVTARAPDPGLGTIDGFTIRNGGYKVSLGGVLCPHSAPTVANNTITRNRMGIVCNWRVTEGGVFASGDAAVQGLPSATMDGEGWLSGSADGGVFPPCPSATIVNNTITENGIGIVGDSCSLTISGNVIARNGYGTGVYCYNSSVMIVNNTVVGHAVGSSAGAIYCASCVGTIANTIVAFNRSGIAVYGQLGPPTLSSNCVYGNTTYNYSGLPDPTGTNGNISADPLFIRNASQDPDGQWGTADDDYGDLHLRSGSPCIDAADNAAVPADIATDLDGKPRFLDDPFAPDTGSGTPPIVDMGAYEYRRVYLDVRPEACPNPINRKSRGLVPVAILGTEFFDVAMIDTSSLRLVPAGGGDGVAPVKISVEDVAGPPAGALCSCPGAAPDGRADLVLKFETDAAAGAAGPGPGDERAMLNVAGTAVYPDHAEPFQAADCVRFVPPSDTDADGDVDMQDFLQFQACFDGPNRRSRGSDCESLDLDDDGDVDAADFGVFHACFNGPNRRPKC